MSESKSSDDLALMAHAFASQLPIAEAKEAIAGMYQVSAAEALRLITRGRHLAAARAAIDKRKARAG